MGLPAETANLTCDECGRRFSADAQDIMLVANATTGAVEIAMHDKCYRKTKKPHPAGCPCPRPGCRTPTTWRPYDGGPLQS